MILILLIRSWHSRVAARHFKTFQSRLASFLVLAAPRPTTLRWISFEPENVNYRHAEVARFLPNMRKDRNLIAFLYRALDLQDFARMFYVEAKHSRHDKAR
jgi:hypothetical protein